MYNNRMNITILTYGSRGDVQPFLPLSIGLMARGHSVRLAAPSRFKELVEQYGIKFYPLAGEPEDLSRRLNDVGFNFVKMTREMIDHAVEIGAEMLRQMEDACADADLIVHTFAHAVGAHTLAREMNIPDVHVQLFPMFTPTGDYPNVTMPDLKIRALNRLTHLLSNKIMWWTSSFGYEQVRRRAGLPKRKLYSPFDVDPLRPTTPILCAWSPSILPPSKEWPSHVHVTGYYFFDANDDVCKPPVALQNFLSAGKSPVCVSFGSMVNRDAERINSIVRSALSNTNNRGVILSGWGNVKEQLSDDLIYLDAVSHAWLLPQCKMLIHHGGAGTTAAGLRAGISSVTVPFTADQPFWGKRVNLVGVGSEPIYVNKLSVDKMTQAIVEAESAFICAKAQEVRYSLRSENGVQCAARLIETCAYDFKKF